jgi:hypothetical protein
MNPGWFNLEAEWGPPGRPLPRQTAAQLVGGPRDGELHPTARSPVRFVGPMPALVYVPEADLPELAPEPPIIEYTLQKWVACFDAAPVRVFVCRGHKLPGAP